MNDWEVEDMIPGTTPTHIFTIPLAAAEVAELRITYSQGGKVAFQKELADCQLADQTVTVRLEQEDTLKISNNVDVQIQMKVKTTGGDVLVSKIVKRSAAIVLDREAI